INNVTEVGESLYTFAEHKAAIKALAWSPRQRGLLATGGGATDQRLRFWNAQTGRLLRTVDTKSQVCNIAWSTDGTQLVTTHGYTDNLVVVWKYNTMQPLVRLKGHRERVLYLAVSPNGQDIVTGSADETLRFWRVFPPKSGGSAPTDLFAIVVVVVAASHHDSDKGNQENPQSINAGIERESVVDLTAIVTA
ncbi:substrate-specific activator of APC-dependent proteolysis, partial [Spiromyces aspiralis]